jgi:2-aminoethylphosphonate-pyruvate transaminase
MLRDLGSRDAEFIETIQSVRNDLLELAGTSVDGGYEAILVQGSGTFGLESVVSSTIPRDGALLVLINGAYGRRIAEMARIHGIETITLEYPEDATTSVDDVAELLKKAPQITNVAVVHCETTTGILNPISEIGEVVRAAGKIFFVDAMSSFGAIPVDLSGSTIDYLVTSANKCLEGVPGFSVVLARRESLLKTEGWARTMSLDLFSQWAGLEKNGQFRFTPPTHTILALRQAIVELNKEGGVLGRAMRYRTNHETVKAGMERMGFKTYLDPAHQSYIITSFLYPNDERFNFELFYSKLSERGLVIYPGKLTQEDCFRIGNIGHLSSADMEALLVAIEQVMAELGIPLPLPS